MDDPEKIIADALVSFNLERVTALGLGISSSDLVADVGLSAEKATAVVEALNAAGIQLAPESDPELLRADVLRSIYRFAYLAAVITPAGLAWQFGHALATSGIPLVVASVFGVGVFGVGVALFGGLAHAMKMFANPSRRQLRRVVARRAREERRAAELEQRRLDQVELDRQRSIAEMIEAARKLGS